MKLSEFKTRLKEIDREDWVWIITFSLLFISVAGLLVTIGIHAILVFG